jgi:hypothetical protein
MYDQQIAIVGMILCLIWIIVAALVFGLKDVIVFKINTKYALIMSKKAQAEMMNEMFGEESFDDAMHRVPDMSPTPTF